MRTSGPGWRSALHSSRPTDPGDARRFTVAIVGKPNVGKSTLFNRLVGSRRAITHSEAGVTRDVVEAESRVRDLRCLFQDTGGYSTAPAPFGRLVARRSLETAANANLLILLVEASGITREDQEFVEKLRKYQQKVILVVNKVDGEKQRQQLAEFYELGFSRLVPVSAEHNSNIDELREAVYAAARDGGFLGGVPGEVPAGEAAGEVPGEVPAGEAAGDRAEGPAEGRAVEPELRLAILGKPNTGKSSLLNRLLGVERSLVSELPGTTRDPVSGDVKLHGVPARVIDTAGMRRKSKVREEVEYYSVNRAARTVEEADVVLLVVDAREGLTDQDKKIAALAVRRGRGVVVVLNKWDLMEPGRSALRAARERVRFLFPTLEFAPVVAISAATSFGVTSLLQTILELWEQLRRQVPTPRLNRELRRWVEDYPLPVRGRNVKLRYATQTGVNPVRFVFFVNNRRGYPAGYTRYLENRIRQDLGFDKIPVGIQVRES
jgi:GTP-binding protein